MSLFFVCQELQLTSKESLADNMEAVRKKFEVESKYFIFCWIVNGVCNNNNNNDNNYDYNNMTSRKLQTYFNFTCLL